MGRETEVKLRIANVAELRKKLRRAGARVVAGGLGRVHEFNTLYDTASGDLRKSDRLLRVRVDTPTGEANKKGKKRFRVTFKGPVKESSVRKRSANDRRYGGNHKVREELELDIGDAKEF